MTKSHQAFEKVIVGPEVQLPSSNCLHCQAHLDFARSVGSKAKPKPGSITICFRCGHLMAFNESLRMRELTDQEMIAVAGDKNILAIQRARGAVLKS